ncbi:hypothetical protein Plhal304r1_c042g0121441 [Plasmopara halstedii]
MVSRSATAPLPPHHGPNRFTPSPRQLIATRPQTSAFCECAQQRNVSVTYESASTLAASEVEGIEVNSKIAEIQSRVEELVRRYNDVVTCTDTEDEEVSLENEVVRIPARWRVGDVLLSTHRSLVQAGRNTAHQMFAEFGDDLKANAAIGSQALRMGDAFNEAEEHAAQRHHRLAHIRHALHHVVADKMADNSEEDDETNTLPLAMREHQFKKREHQLKFTIDALYREKDSMANQLQGVLRLQQTLRTTIEQQAQDLVKAERALRVQSEELRQLQEHSASAAEIANVRAASWRDKFQASAKAVTAAEAKVEELVAKVRVQSEEIAKHTFVLQTKTQEMDRYKEIEAARTRAAAAAQAATLADAQATIRKTKAEVLEEKRTIEYTSKDLHEMKDNICQLEKTLSEVRNVKQGLQIENAELLQRLREVQARFGEHRKSRYLLQDKDVNKLETTPALFALRLREENSRNETGNVPKSSFEVYNNDLSLPLMGTTQETEGLLNRDSDTNSIDGNSDEEVKRDEKELNSVMQHVLTTMFPLYLPEESDLTLDERIAQYEEFTITSLSTIQRSPIAAAELVNEDMISRSELDTLQKMYEHEIDAVKQHYVENLWEYKSLIIQQCERRQALESESHRQEIEKLLQLVQSKFHAEQARRSEHLQRVKESLKMLYHALRQSSVSDAQTDLVCHEDKPIQSKKSAKPLKLILRAAILALSRSANRNGRDTKQAEHVHKQLLPSSSSTDTQTMAIAAAMTMYPMIRDIKITKAEPQDMSCQTDLLPILREQEQMDELVTIKRQIELLPTSRHQEQMDKLVTTERQPESCVLPDLKELVKSSKQQQNLFMLHLISGIPISATLLAELRQSLPKLPPGDLYVSNALRLALFNELVRFYAAMEETIQMRSKKCDHIQGVEIAIGSPRDTPYLRRKALEAVDGKNRQRHRRQLFTSGGTAVLQAAPLTSTLFTRK